MPAAYFYTEDDQLAELLIVYGRLNARARKRLIELAFEL